MFHTFKAQVDSKAWPTCRLLLVALALSALLVGSVVSAEEEETYVVDANSTPCIASNQHYTTITAALTAAASDPGVTIDVCPGKYGEQVLITTSLTLKGVIVPSANSGNGAGAAVITVPTAGLSVNATISSSPPNLAAQVLVHASNVTLSDLTIDGTGALPSGSCSSYGVVGVDFDSGSSGTMKHLVVKNQNQSNGSGGFCSTGLGIVANQGVGYVTVRDSMIANYDDYGIYSFFPINIVGNVLRSAPGSRPADIGLSTDGSENSTVSSNNIVDNGGGLGIGLFFGLATLSGNHVAVGSGGLAILDVSVGPNVISDNVVTAGEASGNGGVTGIVAVGLDDTVRNNSISGVGDGDIAIFVEPAANGHVSIVTENTINGAGLGISGVTGNNVTGNIFHNVGQLTKP